MSLALDIIYPPSDLESIFSVALAKYANQTGHDLRNHSFASKIDGCNSAEPILAVFQKQAKAFDEFRDGGPKLIQRLQLVVSGLYARSTSSALGTAVSLVSPNKFLYFLHFQYRCHVGVSPCISNLFWDSCPFIRAYLCIHYPLALLISGITKPHKSVMISHYALDGV